jgi:DNA polymerase III subunit epsilon
MSLDQLTFTGFDLETAGRYPLESEICEIAAIKYRNGQLAETYQTLVRPQMPMSDEVIAIHGITNEMVANAPRIHEVIADFKKFVEGTYLIAHHAPFDMGFLTVAMEKANIPLPTLPVICSSRLARKIIVGSTNHKLQTLIPFLGLEQGTAHRALDDARACLQVGLHCFEKAKLDSLEAIFKAQDGALEWKDFSLDDLKYKSKDFRLLIEGIENHSKLKLTYHGSSKSSRIIEPIGIVRNPEGDFFLAYDQNPLPKRFYLNKVVSIEKV